MRPQCTVRRENSEYITNKGNSNNNQEKKEVVIE